MRVVAIIPAAGSGSRVSGDVPKQFILFNNREMISYTLEVFQNSEVIDEIIVATSGQGRDILHAIKERDGLTKLTKIVDGGLERQDSVYNALKEANLAFDDLAVVHDAARALLPPEVLARAVATAKEKGSALVCQKARDTIGFLENGDLAESGNLSYIDRNKVYLVQTPQIFRYGELTEAFERAYSEGWYGTDESTIMRRAGYPVFISDGSALNFKITTDEDLVIFSKLVAGRV
ncbi:MAG: 2-C-methyl-D-erythritol 4-phosphate cytidylyltransferase [Ignavibacteriales bacterium]|nr:MAG: 2-C-methyl-D-erythritol 4-phosphate cytidylyltransferase [Ignavibacteriaceae bacterium]MBW7874276.1 2-C-methyl-D-erythritol 4-phosphate cytidylyltransferase [Ignavibacteria bacterium]MCZ2142680.1 2-C-methyl-D-erythritol 4-phosphate cytidylyltransferase [Ignavibacteriales bacterium]MBV6443778.1 2-C-methyl-D-erythritol 4-phosphate cytidylyltransferase [Ignavibacteriaceae bacterium]MBZ0196609.1 2-C-methyl-D-erythritol 4-phosphate cytidylyltransferase [Ignavibacteriaceae bacterium]